MEAFSGRPGASARQHDECRGVRGLLAGVGAGLWPDVDAACQATVRLTGSTVPQPGEQATYEKYYDLYRQLYPALKEISHKLGE